MEKQKSQLYERRELIEEEDTILQTTQLQPNHTISAEFNDGELLAIKNKNHEIIYNPDGSVTIFPPSHPNC